MTLFNSIDSVVSYRTLAWFATACQVLLCCLSLSLEANAVPLVADQYAALQTLFRELGVQSYVSVFFFFTYLYIFVFVLFSPSFCSFK